MEITSYLSECIKNDIPVSFSKYGDGEYNCVTGHHGHNCDNDNYTNKLKYALIESFKYMVNVDNAYLGIWHNTSVTNFWESLTNRPVKWVNYHSIIMSDSEPKKDKIELYKTIQKSP